ncbi:MAG TPA: aminotransferase class III-fold pyridoxal phosphate-dependent enzyme [Steroidobacteraceae bacterium]|jgi:acetylornithine/N-succinyldiaminopimelate aminotransferase|nr:aminotransferase class III-fold pyridoxal phosphate-dependent enzyme [Steroidobacteraceae bacterium]
MSKHKRISATTDSGIRAAARQHEFLAPVFSQYPLEVASAQGVWLTTSRGERVLDLYGGHAVAALGYAHPAWTAALARQAESCQFQSNAVAMRVRAQAARRLARFSRLPFASVFLVNSGAEANENALKVALRMTGRAHVAAIEGGFHGRTAAAGAVTWGAQAKWYGFPRTPFDVSFIPRGDAGAITAQVTRDTAAVIVEPVQGLAGAVDLGAAFLAALRARCDEVGALLIFDEVQCGMGRTGEPFAANFYAVRPDMLTTAKALGNGFPCAALLLSPLASAALRPESLGTTFGGGPLACAAINAVIAAIREERLLERVRRMGAYIRRSCVVGPVTGCQGAGLLVGLRTSRPAREIHSELLECGILAGTATDPHVLRLLPPYILEEQHVDMLRDALRDLPA